MRGMALLCLIAMVASGCSTGEAFAPAEDDLCERIEPAELTRIVGEAFTAYGAAPSPAPFAVSWDSDTYRGCAWTSSEENEEDATVIGLIVTEPAGWYEQWVEIDEYFHPHQGLSESVRVGGALGQPPVQVGGPGDWTPGIEVRLLVEGQDRTLEYWVNVPAGFEGDAEPLLTIADDLLQIMGWLP